MTRKDRLETITMLLNDPVVEMEPKEALQLVYHALAYEIHMFRIARIERRLFKHGKFIKNTIRVANFQHELQEL